MNNFLEINWEQERPDAIATDAFWSELKITQLLIDTPAIHNTLAEFRRIFTNGGAEFACFELPDDAVLHWFASRNRLEEMDFFRRILVTPVVRGSALQLKIPETITVDLELKTVFSFTLGGQIAAILRYGGAYTGGGSKSSDRELKNIGDGFCESLFDDRYSEILVQSSGEDWSPWFHEIGIWNSTWFGIDKRLRRFWLLAVTDTD
jgi:hypothetical protein